MKTLSIGEQVENTQKRIATLEKQVSQAREFMQHNMNMIPVDVWQVMVRGIKQTESEIKHLQRMIANVQAAVNMEYRKAYIL